MEEIILFFFAPMALGVFLFTAVYSIGLGLIGFWHWFQSGAFHDES